MQFSNRNFSVLFYLFMFINVFCKSINLYNNSIFYKILFFLGLIFICIKIINEKYRVKELLLCLLLIILSFLTFYVTRRPTLFISVLAIVGVKNIDLKKLFKPMLNIKLICFFIMVFLSFMGLIGNDILVTTRDGVDVVRYSLGYGHPNTLQLMAFTITSLILYLNKKKLSNVLMFFLLLFNGFVFIFSQSRTGFLCSLLLIFLFYFINYLSSYKNFIRKFSIFILFFSIIFSFGTAKLYGEVPIINEINVRFSHRIAYANYYLNNYGFSLFGHPNVENDNKASFDNGFIFMYIQYGFIGLIIILFLLLKICFSSEYNKDIKLPILMIVYSLYFIEESFICNIFLNNLLLFAGDYIFDRNDIDKEGMVL